MTADSHAYRDPGSGEPVAKDEPEGWWQGLIGPGKALDPERHFLICSNVLGGCGGTTGPCSIDPAIGAPYGPSFPRVSIRDMVRLQKRLLDALGVRRLVAVIGGSLGGMQVLEWGVEFGAMVESVIPIAIGPHQSAWAIALNELSRLAITSDPQWHGGAYASQP